MKLELRLVLDGTRGLTAFDEIELSCSVLGVIAVEAADRDDDGAAAAH